MGIISKARLRQYLKLEYNVLFIGLHGIGKTTIVKEVVEEAGLKWKYFSASTLDPWVDFVGVPKVVTEDNGVEHLKLIRPLFIENDEVEFIFLDEFNRAPDKVINAVMELIQFKSINGHKMNSLKVIWAAINPEDDDDTYSVNHLDPAQMDRFQVHLDVPYKVDTDYFFKKYPSTGPIFHQWWHNLPGDIQKKVSPRRLDYAANAYANGCRLADFLPTESGIEILRKALGSVPFHEAIKEVSNLEEAETFIKDINNTTRLLDLIKTDDVVAIDFFKKYGISIPKELAQPFADYLFARKQGVLNVTSLEDLINRLPNEKGNQGTAVMINHVDFKSIYRKGGSFESDIRDLFNTKTNVVTKLANRCVDIIFNIQGDTLVRALWGVEGKSGAKKTNLHEILLAISKVGGMFTSSEKQKMNDKLFERKIVDTKNYL
jgi:hypothetical protein